MTGYVFCILLQSKDYYKGYFFNDYAICSCSSGLRFKVLMCNLCFRCFINFDLNHAFTLKGPSCVILILILTLSYVFFASYLSLGTILQGLFIQWLCNSQLFNGVKLKVLALNLWFMIFIDFDLSPIFTLKGPSCVTLISILTLSHIFLNFVEIQKLNFGKAQYIKSGLDWF
jgi:hypothetical protein